MGKLENVIKDIEEIQELIEMEKKVLSSYCESEFNFKGTLLILVEIKLIIGEMLKKY